MNKPIEIDGDGDDFTIFLFSHPVKEPNTIKLELAPPEKGVHIGLHIFQELLQIFVDGLKYFYGKRSNKDDKDEGKVDINSLNEENIDSMKRYFLSIGFQLILDVFTPENYVSKPDIFNDKSLIKENTMLDEYFYEITTYDSNDSEKIYRIGFKFNG
ncbi:hypothetical protein N8569_00430 [bacterium]|nr:hypothetical protein [bacterium]